MNDADFPEVDSVVFMLMTFALVGFLLWMVRTVMTSQNIDVKDRRKRIRSIGIPIIFWLVGLKQISEMHILDKWDAIPPRIFFIVLVPLITIVIFLFSKKYAAFLRAVPMRWLIGIQVFRILMEWILFDLSRKGIVPVQMTWAGRNFDILSGVFALILFAQMRRKKPVNGSIVVAYNFLGIALLLNVLITGMLSAPTPFRVFMNEPANTFIAYYPFVWLPAFVVPFAFFMHFSSLKKYFMERKSA